MSWQSDQAWKKYIGDCKMEVYAVACWVSDYWWVLWNPDYQLAQKKGANEGS